MSTPIIATKQEQEQEQFWQLVEAHTAYRHRAEALRHDLEACLKLDEEALAARWKAFQAAHAGKTFLPHRPD